MICLLTGESFINLLVFLIGSLKAVFNILEIIVDAFVETIALILERVDMDTILNITIVLVGSSLLGPFPALQEEQHSNGNSHKFIGVTRKRDTSSAPPFLIY